MISGRATPAGTARFRARHVEAADAGHFRRLGELEVSSIGLGTYLGEASDVVDEAYEEAVLEALSRGCNLFDTAINYRHQRSERALGRAITRAVESGVAARDEIVVCTKGGFLPFDTDLPENPHAYLREHFIDSGLVSAEDLVASCHALSDRFLADQIENSRANLALETIDLYYVHNPETQLSKVSISELESRVGEAFDFLEVRVDAKEIAGYGLATWSGLRQPPGEPDALCLERLHALAGAGLVAIQAPLNLAMPEALASPTQELAGVVVPLAVVARSLGLGLITSASILQGELATLPPEIAGQFSDLQTDAQRALQFTRSLPGVSTALVGMSSVDHVRENLALAAVPPASAETIQSFFA